MGLKTAYVQQHFLEFGMGNCKQSLRCGSVGDLLIVSECLIRLELGGRT